VCRIICLLLIITAPVAEAASFSFKTIDVPGIGYTTPYAINDSGTIVGSADATGFMYSLGLFSPIAVPGAVSGFSLWGTTPTGIADSGEVFGTYSSSVGGTRGFVVSGATIDDLNYPGASNTYIYGVSSGGTAIGNFSSGLDFHGFTRDTNGFHQLDVPVPFPVPSSFEQVFYYSINKNGTILGGQEWNQGGNTLSRLFVYQGGTITFVPTPLQAAIFYPTINDARTVAGSYYDAFNVAHAFLYANGIVEELMVPGATSAYAMGINNPGDVVGGYFASDRSWHAYLATPVPEVTTKSMTVAGVLILLVCRKVCASLMLASEMS
jgi:uncharacterized membrane protein